MDWQRISVSDALFIDIPVTNYTASFSQQVKQMSP